MLHLLEINNQYLQNSSIFNNVRRAYRDCVHSIAWINVALLIDCL